MEELGVSWSLFVFCVGRKSTKAYSVNVATVTMALFKRRVSQSDSPLLHTKRRLAKASSIRIAPKQIQKKVYKVIRPQLFLFNLIFVLPGS